MAIYTDNFNYGNTTLSSGNWGTLGLFQAMAVVSNECVPNSAAADCVSVYITPTKIGDMYAQARIVSLSGTGDQSGPGVYLRGDPTNNGGVWVVVNASATNNISIGSWAGGSYTLLGQRVKSPAPAAGDILKATIEGIDAACIVKVYINGVQIGANVTTVQTNNNDVGYPGVAYSSATTTYNMDDFEGGDLVAAAAPTQLPPFNPIPFMSNQRI